MSINPVRTEQQDPAEPSTRVAALMLEMDSALHAGRIPVLSDDALRELDPDELRQLTEFRQQLDSVYKELSTVGHRGRPMPKTTQFGQTAHADPETDEDGEILDNPLVSWGMPSDQFGHFKILYALGMGGHGVVFLAHDQMLNRLVALKVPRPEVLIQPGMRKRFLAEGRASAMLAHPHIVTVFESGEVGAICYLAQDYVPGPTLAQWLQDYSKPVAPRVAAELILKLAEAVAFAHSRQILHRDIKPGNILLAPLPTLTSPDLLECYLPKLADFGIAKLLRDQNQTQTGSILGTPAYMAPEQASGRRELVCQRVDIYGLGTILYELLTHRPLYRSENDLEMLQLVLHNDPPSPRSIVPSIPRDLEAICLKCLEKEPQQRYATANELVDDLRRFLAGKFVVARKYSLAHRLARFARRPQTRSRVVAAMLLLSVLGLGWASWFARRERAAAVAERSRSQSHQQQLAEEKQRRYPLDLRQAMQLLTEPAAGGTDRPNVARHARDLLERHIPARGENDQRGFEWHYLWKLLHPADSVSPLQVLHEVPAHRQDAYHVTFSPDGQRVATASQDGTARVFDASTGQELLVLTGHQSDVNCVEFSPDGKWLATASDDFTAALWDATTGEHLRDFWQHTDKVVGVSFHATLPHIAAGAADGAVRVWDLSRPGEAVAKLDHGKLARIEAIAYSPNGRHLATVSRADGLQLWDVARDYAPHAAMHRQPLRAESVCFSRDGRLIGMANGGDIWVLSADTGQILGINHLHLGGIKSLRFHQNSRLLMVASANGDPQICDWPTGDFWQPFDPQSRAWCVAGSLDGTKLAVACYGGTLYLWDALSVSQLFDQRWELADRIPHDIALSPDGTRIALASHSSRGPASGNRPHVEIRTLAADSLPAVVACNLPDHTALLSNVCWSPDSQEISLGVKTQSGELTCCFQAVTGQRLEQPQELGQPADVSPSMRIAYSPEGAFFIIQQEIRKKGECLLRVYERSSGKLVQTTSAPESQLLEQRPDWAFSPAGDLLVTSLKLTADQRVIRVLKFPELEQCATWTSPASLSSPKFQPDGRHMWFRRNGFQFILADVMTGAVLAEFSLKGMMAPDHGNPAAFSPDARLLAVLSKSSLAFVSLPRGEVCYQIPLPRQIQNCYRLQFSADGKTLAAFVKPFGGDFEVHIWRENQRP